MNGASAPWVLNAQEVIAEQKTSLETGLSAAEVEKRRQQYGFNELAKEPGKPLWKLVLEQFDDMLVKVRAYHFLRRAGCLFISSRGMCAVVVAQQALKLCTQVLGPCTGAALCNASA